MSVGRWNIWIGFGTEQATSAEILELVLCDTDFFVFLISMGASFLLYLKFACKN